MANMTIVEAAEYFGISKEAIHNRVRRGSLSVIIKDGIKLVAIDEDAKTITPSKTKSQTRKVSNVSHDKYNKLLEEQNAKLQEKVEKLENETRTLRDQKELMLIQEREKIEQIYKDKDEQLKNILSSISSQFMLGTPQIEEPKEEVVETEIDTTIEDKVISLKKYLKKNNINTKKIKKIKARFKKRAKKDNRIIVIGKKYYMNLTKYDYADLV